MTTKWDQRFLDMAKHVSQWSKDPSTQTGAVIVRPDRTVASIGYNGFPRGVSDRDDRLADRDMKLEMTVHCEMNAIITAREPLHGHTLYCYPFTCCARCAAHVIQAGIVRVVSPVPSKDIRSRWAESLYLSRRMFREAGVTAIEDASYVSDRQG